MIRITRTRSPEVAPSPAPVYDFLATNTDYDNPNSIQALRDSYQTTYESHYNHYWNDPAIAHESDRTKRLIAAEAAANQARLDTQTNVLGHINSTSSSSLAGLSPADHDDLMGRYNAQIWGWLDTPKEDWEGDKTSAGLSIGNGMYDRLARDIGARNGILVTPENTILRGNEARMYSARTEMEQARSNYAIALSGKKTRALRKAYSEAQGHRVSKKEAIELASQEWKDHKLSFYDTIRSIRETELAGTPEEKQLAINTELIQEDIREFKNLEVAKLINMTDPKMGWLIQRLNKGNIAWRTTKNAGLGTALFQAGAFLTGATGGILAPAVGAALVGWRFYSRYATYQMRKEGVGQASQADSNYYEAAMAQFTDAHKKSMSTTDIFSRADTLSFTLEQERRHREQVTRLKSTGMVIGTILLPRLIYEIPGVKDGVHGAWDWLHDHSPWNDNKGGTTGSTTIDTTPDHPIGGQVEVVPNLSAAQWEGLRVMDMRTATGEYPWDRAVSYFHGDQSRAVEWLKEATEKAGGQWHNTGDHISTNDWISINGVSDTDSVWDALTAADPVGR